MSARLIRVSGAASLKHGETRVFSWQTESGEREGFVLRYDGSVFAYQNQCPHWPIPLDIGDGFFYNAILDRIRCRTHGACFLPETGACDRGPCGGESLKRFDLEIEGQDALVRIP